MCIRDSVWVGVFALGHDVLDGGDVGVDVFLEFAPAGWEEEIAWVGELGLVGGRLHGVDGTFGGECRGSVA